ncbi:MAG: hypothetical protein ACRD1T_17575, partial [Acidimicrobiia bacterium]
SVLPAAEPPKKEPCKRIYLHGFLGDKDHAAIKAFRKKLADAEAGLGPNPDIVECLMIAGHVGLSFESDSPIIGFLPNPGSEPMWQVMKTLKARTSFPGKVGDDTYVFDAAKKRGLSVLKVEYVFPESEYNRLKAACDALRSSCDYEYGFPGAGDCNCASFPARIGFPIPEPTGQMLAYMDAMAKTPSPVRMGDCEG